MLVLAIEAGDLGLFLSKGLDQRQVRRRPERLLVGERAVECFTGIDQKIASAQDQILVGVALVAGADGVD